MCKTKNANLRLNEKVKTARLKFALDNVIITPSIAPSRFFYIITLILTNLAVIASLCYEEQLRRVKGFFLCVVLVFC